MYVHSIPIPNDIKDYNKIGVLKRELSGLYLQRYALVQACARQSQALIALAKEQDLADNYMIMVPLIISLLLLD